MVGGYESEGGKISFGQRRVLVRTKYEIQRARPCKREARTGSRPNERAENQKPKPSLTPFWREKSNPKPTPHRMAICCVQLDVLRHLRSLLHNVGLPAFPLSQYSSSFSLRPDSLVILLLLLTGTTTRLHGVRKGSAAAAARASISHLDFGQSDPPSLIHLKSALHRRFAF